MTFPGDVSIAFARVSPSQPALLSTLLCTVSAPCLSPAASVWERSLPPGSRMDFFLILAALFASDLSELFKRAACMSLLKDTA